MGEHHHHHQQQQEQQKQQEKEEDWKEVVRRGGSLREVSLDNGVRGWASPPGNFFAVRGPHYFSKKQKSAAGDCLLTPLGMDWLRSHSRLDHVLSHPSNRVMTTYHAFQNHANSTSNSNINKMMMKKKHGPFFMAINLQVPGRDHHSAVFYYVTEDPILPESLLHRFIHGDDSFRNARFKLINRIVRGPWIVRATVGNHAACLLGKALTCTYIKGPDYLEIDVDIGSSALASAILHLALGYVNSVTVDMAFLIESQAEEELPERILGSVRVAQIEMEAAVHVEAAHGPASDPHFVGSEITTTTTTTTSSWRKFSRSFSLLGHTGKPSKVEVEVEIEQKYEHEEKVLTKY